MTTYVNNIKLFLSKNAAVKYCCFVDLENSQFQKIFFYSLNEINDPLKCYISDRNYTC